MSDFFVFILNIIKPNMFTFLAENISTNMSNYITMALDPNTKGHLEYMQQWDPTFPELLESLENELDTILAEKYNNSILKLFEKVAIRYFLLY